MNGLTTPSSLCSILVAASFVAAVPGRAQASEVVVVLSSDAAQYRLVEQAFRAGFDRPVRTLALPDGAGQLGAASSQAPVVFAVGAEAARSVAALKLQTPVVATLVADLERFGLTSGGTLVPMFVPAARQLALVRGVLPKARRFGVLYDPNLSKALVADCQSALSRAGLVLEREEVSDRREVAAKARALLSRIDVLWLVPDSTVVTPDTFKFLVSEGFKNRIPIVGYTEGMAKAGALISIQATYEELGATAASAATKLISNAVASPESPDGKTFLNAKSASLLELTLPFSSRSQAKNVFE